jgi:uncharacterized protein (DUF58 family)
MITKIGYTLISSLILISFLSLFLSLSWVFFFSFFLYFLIFYDAIIFRINCKRIMNLKIDRIAESEAAYYNTPFKIRLKINNLGKHPVKHLLIVEEIPLGFKVIDGETSFWGEIKKDVEIKYTIKPLQIGFHEFKNVIVILFDPLLLFFKRNKFPIYTSVEVKPVINMPLIVPSMRTLGFVKEYGFKEAKVKGIGYDFHSIREYQFGDDLRYIAWRNVAKSPERKLFIIEREEEKKTDIVIILDVSKNMIEGYEGERKFDVTALSIANLAYLTIRNEDRFHLVCFSSNYMDYTKVERYSQIPLLLDKLSKIKLTGTKDFKKLYEFIIKNDLKNYFKIIITDRYLNKEDIQIIKEINDLGNLFVIILSSFGNLINDDIIKLYIDYESINIESLIKEFKKNQIKPLFVKLNELQMSLIHLYKVSKYYAPKRKILA